MTTFHYTTTSTGGRVTDEAAVQDLCEEYYFTVDPVIEGGQLVFNATDKPNAGFSVFESVDQLNQAEEEFFERLSEYLVEDFYVKCVETQGDGEPSAWKWTVSETGDVEMISL